MEESGSLCLISKQVGSNDNILFPFALFLVCAVNPGFRPIIASLRLHAAIGEGVGRKLDWVGEKNAHFPSPYYYSDTRFAWREKGLSCNKPPAACVFPRQHNADINNSRWSLWFCGIWETFRSFSFEKSKKHNRIGKLEKSLQNYPFGKSGWCRLP